MKRVIITGGNGFVGNWLVKELLERGVEVYAVVRNVAKVKMQHSNLHIILCDMSAIENLPNLVEKRGFDAFYHLAWEGSTGMERAEYDIQLRNVMYSCDALKVAKDMGCRKFFAAGTITEQVVDSALLKESVSPNLIYGITKKTTRDILRTLAQRLDITFVWMQFSNVFGPDNFTGNLIGYTLATIAEGNVPKYSSAKQPYDFIYVKDLVKAIVLLGECELKHDIYFLGSGQCRILKEYLEVIPKAIGRDIDIGIGERPDDGLIYLEEWFDTTNLQQDTAYKTEYSFEEAIKETYELWSKR